MRILKSALAFVVMFCTLAATVVCAAVVNDEFAYVEDSNNDAIVSEDTTIVFEYPTENDDEAVAVNEPVVIDEDGNIYKPRLTAPAKNNPYYYSNKNVFYKHGYGMPNCTCYAWGRAYEILGKEPQLCIYDAHLWYGYNKDNRIYAYGQEPKLGAIACWKYKNYDSGHVAVVEKITDDTVYFSNSAWGGSEFYVNSTPIDEPEKGMNWIFQGYIYIGEYQSGAEEAGDVYRITSDDGVNMRSGAGTSYGVIGALPYNAIVTVTDTKEANGYKWGYGCYNGVCGWFVLDFAELISSSGGDDKPTEPPTEPPTEAPTEPPTQAETEPAYELGDADLDGEITIIDATHIQLVVARIIEVSDEQFVVCDVDKDGEISIIDSTAVQLIVARV